MKVSTAQGLALRFEPPYQIHGFDDVLPLIFTDVLRPPALRLLSCRTPL
jgi:hypothetical protein